MGSVQRFWRVDCKVRCKILRDVIEAQHSMTWLSTACSLALLRFSKRFFCNDTQKGSRQFGSDTDYMFAV